MECKCRNITIFFFILLELIDTLWNVNDDIVYLVFCAKRINRYIMECKFCFSSSWLFFVFELIDTLWNVNK